MGTLTRAALIEQVPQQPGSATRDGSEHPFVLAGHLIGEGCEVVACMLSQCVGDRGHADYFGLRLAELRLRVFG